MAVQFEAQSEDDVKQIRSRELQLESVEKLNDLIPVINNVDLEKIETQTTEIKNIVNQNLEEQPDIQEVIDKVSAMAEGFTDLADSIDSLKKSTTQLKKSVTEVKNNVKKIDEKLEE